MVDSGSFVALRSDWIEITVSKAPRVHEMYLYIYSKGINLPGGWHFSVIFVEALPHYDRDGRIHPCHIGSVGPPSAHVPVIFKHFCLCVTLFDSCGDLEKPVSEQRS